MLAQTDNGYAQFMELPEMDLRAQYEEMRQTFAPLFALTGKRSAMTQAMEKRGFIAPRNKMITTGSPPPPPPKDNGVLSIRRPRGRLCRFFQWEAVVATAVLVTLFAMQWTYNVEDTVLENKVRGRLYAEFDAAEKTHKREKAEIERIKKNGTRILNVALLHAPILFDDDIETTTAAKSQAERDRDIFLSVQQYKDSPMMEPLDSEVLLAFQDEFICKRLKGDPTETHNATRMIIGTGFRNSIVTILAYEWEVIWTSFLAFPIPCGVQWNELSASLLRELTMRFVVSCCVLAYVFWLIDITPLWVVTSVVAHAYLGFTGFVYLVKYFSLSDTRMMAI